MCGIFAYVGEDERAIVKAVRGLKDLEYRGYDSWGVAVKTEKGILARKGVGKISSVDENDFGEFVGTISVGHTRWATHGGVSEKNSHPHFNGDNTIAVVHNGIIENYQELKKKLGEEFFRSETDTEVIPHLIQRFLDSGLSFEEAFVKTCRELAGSFAFVALHRDSPFILGARRGSPLVAGIGEKEYFLASDTPAFLDYTNRVYFIDDGEYVRMEPSRIAVFNFERGEAVEKREEKISWSKIDASKGGFPHFMLKEILEQKETLHDTFVEAVEHSFLASRYIKEAKNCFLTACGTAGHVSMVAEYLFSEIARVNAQFVPASEFQKVLPFVNEETVVIPTTQSGETADVLGAIGEAKKKKAKIVSIINVRGSSVERASDVFLPINAGPEKAVASTKAATSQMLMFAYLAYALAGNESSAQTFLEKAVRDISAWLSDDRLASIKAIAKDLVSSPDLFVIGKGALYPIALEVALKIKEVSYIHAEGFAAGELKHGTIALVEKGTPAVALVGDDHRTSDILSNIQELKARGARIIGIAPKFYDSFDYWIEVPETGYAAPIAHVIPGQILAYYLAALRGLDPDKPRNLAKSVTVK